MAQLKLQGIELNLWEHAKSLHRRDSRKPIIENGTLEDDQNRRDFTINVLAVRLHNTHFPERLSTRLMD